MKVRTLDAKQISRLTKEGPYQNWDMDWKHKYDGSAIG